MSDLLTTKQVIDILKVDRITIYRMLQDGRLKGVKIGQQWRFPQKEVDRLLNQYEPQTDESNQLSTEISFPTHCVQTIQDLFADVGQISAVVVDMNGQPMTEVSHPSPLYQVLRQNEAALQACRDSYRDFADRSSAGTRFFTCFCGMNYVGAPIMDKDQQVALFLSGQFYWQAPEPREETERFRRLSSMFNLAFDTLIEAARMVPVIDPARHLQVEEWPNSAAKAVNSILKERIGFLDRLQRIADLTHIS